MTQKTRALALVPVLAAFTLALGACVWEVSGPPEVSPQATSDDGKAIVGGVGTTIAQHPWQISLQDAGGGHFCGGSILSDRWILTAQHCVDGSSAGSLRVLAGATRLSQAASGQTKTVAEVVRFPGYSSPERGEDVALLRLSQPLTLSSTVAPIPFALPTDESVGATAAGVNATVSGWGTLANGGSPDTLQAVDVPLVSNATAQSRYNGETISADQLAAGVLGTGGRDSCQGDSGGPLSVSSSRGRILVGVVSWGYGCGDPNYPGMYARVASFASWIASTTGIMSGGGGGGGGGGGTTPPAETTVTLLDRANVSGSKDSFTHIGVTVPAGTTALDVAMTGSSGDADLYVRAGSQPTTATWQCRPYTEGSAESCTFASPAAGSWYVSIHGYTAYSGLRIVVTARVAADSAPPDETPPNGEEEELAADGFATWSGGTGWGGAWVRAGDTALSDGGARLRRGTGDLQRTIAVTGAEGLSMTLRARVQSFESSDRAWVKVSADGGAFTTVHTFTSAASDDTWHEMAIDLSAFDGATSLVVRFDAGMSAATDSWFVDDVAVLGTR